MRPYLLSLLVLLPVTASAQDVSAPSLKWPTIVYSSAVAFDYSTTYRGLQLGATERNPILRPLQNRPVALVATGAALDAAGVWAWNRYVGRKHPKLAVLGLYAMSAARIWMASHNWQTIHAQRRPTF